MNYNLPLIPSRSVKPRNKGLTMVMDKGLSVAEASNLADVAGHLTDFVKLGFGTSAITNRLKEKIEIYQKAGIKVYLGGTLFEAFLIRNLYKDYIKLVEELGINTVEVSDGSMYISHEKKCSYIKELSTMFTVISEVGCKDAGVHLEDDVWISHMKDELNSGSLKVIAEARESGNVGIFNSAGKTETSLVDKIISEINADNIIWETPLKAQQVWFIKKLGSDVNLGNIASNEIIALETLRLGLRGDTFFEFLPEELKKYKL